MSSNQIQAPEEVYIESITIDGNDVMGLFLSVDIYENIFTPIITGNIQLLETDGSAFIEKKGIEGNEDIKISARCNGEQQLEFEGVLNGLRNKVENKGQTIYTFDFTTKEMRKNEEVRISKSFKDKAPEEIVEEMVKEMDGKMDKSVSTGQPMTYISPRQRPWDVIKYVITHAASNETSAEDGDDVNQQEHKAEGTTGFLLWQTADGFRFCSIDDLLKRKAGEDRGEFTSKLANKGESLETTSKSILVYDFPIMGDIQAKMRSGSFRSTNILFDIDKGLYKEYDYSLPDDQMTEKQKEAVPEPTRVTWRVFSNERHNQECSKAQPNTGDQSKLNTGQIHGRENSFDDSQGSFSLYPQFDFRAGDFFTAKIGKIKGEKEGGYDKKYSGKYVIKEVAHNFRVDAKGYTKIGVIRSTKQQDDSSSQ